MEQLYKYLPRELVTFVLVTLFSLLIGLSQRRLSLKREGDATHFGTDRTFTFITKTPPAAVLIKKACGIETASPAPNKTKVASLTKEQVRKIAETKMPDLNAASVEAAMSMIAGTARSMGITVTD